ncbi:hypothetical protein Vau01_011770 [Virgisporangium aurantiacum]|uniref:Uncharacterized protein n=1 Tax=Virgisporangium aurantiacum TaxID=175570 RepID=A0A8J3Z1S9_9ACTN|nr:hypothetical protein Vau01_011770 [Virgisporangium aurantiacum]
MPGWPDGRRQASSFALISANLSRRYSAHVGMYDEDREVQLTEEFVILPDQTSDDTDAGWGEHAQRNDDRLLAERPPHWD